MAASCRAAPRKLVRPKKGHNREEQSSTSRSRAGSMRFAPDSSLERAGFELRVLSWRGAAFSTPLIPPFARSHTRNAKLPSALGPGVRFALAPAASLVSGDGYERHQFGGTHHVRRSCDFSSRTNSAAHSRASCIFPASRKARAFARAWLSADRSSGVAFLPSRRTKPGPRAVGCAFLPVQLGINGRQVSIVSALIAKPIYAGSSTARQGLPIISKIAASGRKVPSALFLYHDRSAARRSRLPSRCEGEI